MSQPITSSFIPVVTPALTDQFPIVQGGLDKKETVTQLNTLLGSNIQISSPSQVTGLGTAAAKAASDNTKSNLASVVTPTTINNIAIFNDTAGTVGNSGVSASTPTGSGNLVLQTSPTLTTPNIGAATGTSLSVSGQLSSTVATGTAPLAVSSTTRVSNLNAATCGNADTVTTNANLTGDITSVGNATTYNNAVPLSKGGLNASLIGSAGGIFYSQTNSGAVLAGTGFANQLLMSGSSSAPHWSTATYPSSTTINQILFSSITNQVTGLATANDGVLVTSAAGVPSIASVLPAAVQSNITAAGALTATSITFSGANQTALSAFESATATLTLATGFTTTPTFTGKFMRVGNIVSLTVAAITATIVGGGTATFTVTGIPARFYPTAGTQWGFLSIVVNGGFAAGGCGLNTTGTLSVYPTNTYSGTFVAGTSGGFSMSTFTWALN